jgi:hypothetical protein
MSLPAVLAPTTVPAFSAAVALIVAAAQDFATAKADGVVTLEEILAAVEKEAPEVLVVAESAKEIPAELTAHPIDAAEVASYAAVDICVDLFGITDSGSVLKEGKEISAAIESVLSGIVKALPGGISTFEIIQVAIGNATKVVAALSDIQKIPAEFRADIAGELKLMVASSLRLLALSKQKTA